MLVLPKPMSEQTICAHTLMCLTGEVKGLGNEDYLLAVARIKVASYQLVVGLADEFVVSGLAEFKVIVIHRQEKYIK